MTTERIDIVIREDGSRVVKRNIESMGTSATAAERSMRLLNSAIGLVGAGLVVSKVIQYADAWANAAGLIAIATKNTAEAANVTKRLFEAAQDTRTGFGDVVSVYSAAARAAESLGASQNQLITFSKGLGEALAVQHVSAEQASGALLQLGQLLGSGKVRAQEFNSVLLGTPVILQTVAKGMGDATGNVADLRKKLNAGTLTSREFFDAFLKGLPSLEADFKKSAFTFGQGFTLISNALTKFIGELNEATGASHLFTSTARTIADNMDVIGAAVGQTAKALAGLVTTFIVFKAATKTAEFGNLISGVLSYSSAIAAGTVVQLGSAEANRQRAVAAAESAAATASATAAEVAGNVAAARAAVVATEAQVAQTTATQAAILVAREDAALKLANSIRNAQAAKLAIEVGLATGVQNAATQSLQVSVSELTVAEEAHAAAMTELAALGTQQSRLNAVLIAETRAQTVAQTQLAEVQAAGTAANAAAAATATRASVEATAATAAAAGSTSLLGQAFNVVKGAATGALIAIGRLFVLINTNPFIFLATAIAAAVAWFVLFGKDLNAGIDQFTTLGDVAVVAGNRIVDSVSAISDVFVRVFGGLFDIVMSALGPIGVAIVDAVKQYAVPFETFFDGVGTGFAGIVRGIARFFDAIAGLLTGFGIAISRAFTGLGPLVKNVFNGLYNDVAGIVESIINTTIDKLNFLRKAIGQSLIETVHIEKLSVDEHALETYGKGIADAIDAGFVAQGGFLENTVVSIFDDATKRAKDRAIANLKEIDIAAISALRIGPKKIIDEEMTEKERHALEKLKNELREVLNQFAPLEGATLEMERAQSILNAALGKGLINGTQFANFTTLLKKHYVDILDPLGKLNREMDEQIKLLNLSARAREVEAQVIQITKSLLQDGVILTQKETDALRDKLKIMQSLNEATQIQDQLLADSVEARRAFTLQLQEIKKLLNDPTSGFTKGDASAALQNQLPELFAGTREAIDTHQKQFETMYAQIAAMRQLDLISEQTATQMRLKVWAQSQQKQLSLASEFFGDLAGLAHSSNKKLAKIGKAAAIAQATIDGILAVQKALGAFPPPFNYIAAAAVGVVALENINKIRTQQDAGFKAGGYTGDMSKNAIAGVTHGQEYVLNAQTTKRIGVANLDALQNGRSPNRAPRWTGNEGRTGGINVNIQNYGTSKKFEVQHLSENEVRIIARDEADRSVADKSPRVIAAQLSDPNSRVSKAVTRNTNTTRSRT